MVTRQKSTRKRNDARLDFRLNQQSKELIEKAAVIRGQSVSDFASLTLVEMARHVVEQNHLTMLTERDRDIFLAILDSDRRPNAALRKAAKRYKAQYG
jgi:uncharacterized protein (DUF1778 family)